ncbi:MAG: sensor histidine kinase [Eubacterium sp.]|nr:sensor histidine kinase [Eubacterium sp.]
MLLKYLKYRWKVLSLILLITAVFSSSYLLFDMPGITVLYPMILTLVIILIVGIIDFLLTAAKHKKLMTESFPEADDVIEEDYQRIIDGLREEEKVSRDKVMADYTNMVEYYTVWAHQIKTPIASMRLNLQGEDSDRARKLIGDLNRIEAYVEMVLTFLRLDSDSTDYLIKEYELDDILKTAIKRFKTDFISKKLSLDYRETGYTVLTDEKWLSFVLEQVISNAVKYTAGGSIKIYMEAPGILRIEDTGIGIAAEDIPRIFENGYTGFNGREDKRASGIGLYLCKRICDNLGHGIKAESKQGVGTTIIIDLTTGKLRVE